MFDLQAVQDALVRFDIDGWLLTDFRGSNVLARRVLHFPSDLFTSRRFAYFIPQDGDPIQLVHRIEQGALEHLPGEKRVYLKWQTWEEELSKFTQGCKRLALEYSPRNGNPYLARVDAGTVELLREANPGMKLVPSGDLIQLFEAVWTPRQWELHQQASAVTNATFKKAWQFIVDSVARGGSVGEADVQQLITDSLHAGGLTFDHPPIVANGKNAGDPHYETGSGTNNRITSDDLILIDMWAKVDEPDGVYSDLSRMGYVGTDVPEQYSKAFHVVCEARDAAIAKVRAAFASDTPLAGWEVDDACRSVVESAGYGEFFVHRTGHSIGRETHGNGANIDNLETKDARSILPGTCFSIEPGIYTPEFGLRTEVDVFVDHDRTVHVTGGELQTAIYQLLEEIPDPQG